jgi:hypothetical protein
VQKGVRARGKEKKESKKECNGKSLTSLISPIAAAAVGSGDGRDGH